MYGYKASLQVKAVQRRKAASMREAAIGLASHQKTGSGLPPSGRRRSRLSNGGLPSGVGTSRASDENGYLDGDPMLGTTPAPNRIDEIDEPGSRDAGAVSGGKFPRRWPTAMGRRGLRHQFVSHSELWGRILVSSRRMPTGLHRVIAISIRLR